MIRTDPNAKALALHDVRDELDSLEREVSRLIGSIQLIRRKVQCGLDGKASTLQRMNYGEAVLLEVPHTCDTEDVLEAETCEACRIVAEDQP